MDIKEMTVAELRASLEGCHQALLSIARNSCCAPCQEAAMVARLALNIGDKELFRGTPLGSAADEEYAPHQFNSRTHYESGDDRDIWCRDCEYHRDHEIHQTVQR